MRTGRSVVPLEGDAWWREGWVVADTAPAQRVPEVRRTEQGYRCGESHHRCRISDEQVAQMRRLHEEGMGYRRIAIVMDLAVTSVRKICSYQRRVPRMAWRDRG